MIYYLPVEFIWLFMDLTVFSNTFSIAYYNVTLDLKTSLKCQYFEIEIYTSTESWINTLSID